MRMSKICLIAVFLIFIFSHSVMASYTIDRVYYSIKVDMEKIEALELKIENDIDNVNTTGLKVIHDGNKFNLMGNWKINFLKRSTHLVSLNFMLPVNLDDFSLDKGLGLSGEGFYTSSNKFYWGLNYFVDKDDWTYELGMIYPFIKDTFFRIGLGNTYWNSNNTLNLGFVVDIN